MTFTIRHYLTDDASHLANRAGGEAYMWEKQRGTPFSPTDWADHYANAALPENRWMRREENAAGARFWESLAVKMVRSANPTPTPPPATPVAHFRWVDASDGPFTTIRMPYGPVTFYAVDNIRPTAATMKAVIGAMHLVNGFTFNPIRHIIFTPDEHGSRVSIAAQKLNASLAALPDYLGFAGDYITIGLDAGHIPACTISHELGHQEWWQYIENAQGEQGPREKATYTLFHQIYEEAMWVDGGELINDETYTGIPQSGHPWKFVEFFPAARHAFVEHGDELARRIAALPKTHYGYGLWRAMKSLYGRVFTKDRRDPFATR